MQRISGRRELYKILAAGLAAVEIIIRSVATVIDQVASLVELLVLAVLMLQDAEQIEFAAGWLFLASLAYWVAPLLYTVFLDMEVRSRGVRLGVTVAAITVGMVAHAALLESLGLAPPIASERLLPLIPYAVAAYVGLSSIALITTRSEQESPTTLVLTVVLGILPVTLLGAYLTGAALLYPLPELFVILWLSYAGVRVYSGARPEEVWINDPVERLGAIPAYSLAGVAGLLITAYIFAGLALSIYPYVVLLSEVGGWTGIEHVSAIPFLFLCAALMAAYGTWYWLRISENHMVHVFNSLNETPPTYLQQLYGDGQRERVLLTPPRYVPGLCLPVGIFSFALVAVSVDLEDTVPLSLIALVIGCLLFAGGTVAATLFNPDPERQDPLIGEQHIIPAAIGVLILSNFTGVLIPGWLIDVFVFGGTTEYPYGTPSLFWPVAFVLELLLMGALVGVLLLPYYAPDVLAGEYSIVVKGLAVGSFGLAVLIPVTVVWGFESWAGDLLTKYLWVMMGGMGVYAALRVLR